MQGPARDGVAIAERRASCARGGEIEGRASGAFAFALNRLAAALSEAIRAEGIRTEFFSDIEEAEMLILNKGRRTLLFFQAVQGGKLDRLP